jgi:hypothetical protein
MEEALHNRIAVALASSAHTPFKTINFKEVLPIMARILANLV